MVPLFSQANFNKRTKSICLFSLTNSGQRIKDGLYRARTRKAARTRMQHSQKHRTQEKSGCAIQIVIFAFMFLFNDIFFANMSVKKNCVLPTRSLTDNTSIKINKHHCYAITD